VVEGGKAICDRKYVVGNFFKSQLAPVQGLRRSKLRVLTMTSALFFLSWFRFHKYLDAVHRKYYI